MLISDPNQSLLKSFIMPQPKLKTVLEASWLYRLAWIFLLVIVVFLATSYALLNTQLPYPQTKTPHASGSHPQTPGATPQRHHHQHSGERQGEILNRTLGFERIFVISLPERSDKQDALAISARLTGLDLTFFDGVIFYQDPTVKERK
jgi:hypothetical protein